MDQLEQDFGWLAVCLRVIPGGARVLHLGCVAGLPWKTVIGEIPAGWRITLGAVSDEEKLNCWRQLVVTGRPFRYESMPLVAFNLEAAPYDAVICGVEHFSGPGREQLLRKLGAALGPGGRLLLPCPAEAESRWVLGSLDAAGLAGAECTWYGLPVQESAKDMASDPGVFVIAPMNFGVAPMNFGVAPMNFGVAPQA